MNGALLTSEARTATASTAAQTCSSGQRGVLLTLDITAAPAAADTLTVSIEARDPATGKFVTLTAFAATKKGEELEAGATLAFTIYPAAAETTALADHEVQALALPSHWRAVVTHSGAGSWTYSLGATALK
jgi:hypothetical protein